MEADRYEEVLKEALKLVTPSAEEKETVENLARKTLEVCKEIAEGYGGEPMLVGSLRRNTWLPEKKEFDIFILFPTSLEESKLEEYGLEIGKKVFERMGGEYVIEYAQHPYVSGKIDGVNVDIVPCYKVESAEKIRSAVDRTPFHVRYVESKLTDQLANEVRLLKKFLLANEIYGADAKTQGFSGYVCELLVINYGSFLNVLKASLDWEPGVVIDLENFYTEEDYKNLRKKFKDHPLILIDPTDNNRNTTAALSVRCFYKFKKLAKEFLSSPSIDFFVKKEEKPLSEEELKEFLSKRGTELIVVSFKPPRVVPDILWPQLRKFSERLKNILEETKYEFKVLGKDVFTDEREIAVVLLEMEVSKLPTVQKRIGPPVFNLKHSKNFLEKYKHVAIAGPYVEGVNWCVEVERKFLTAKDKLKNILEGDEQELLLKGIPNYVAKQLASEGFEIICEVERIASLMEEFPCVGVFLRKYFEKERLV